MAISAGLARVRLTCWINRRSGQRAVTCFLVNRARVRKLSQDRKKEGRAVLKMNRPDGMGCVGTRITTSVSSVSP
jgi:hypothetical protein